MTVLQISLLGCGGHRIVAKHALIGHRDLKIVGLETAKPICSVLIPKPTPDTVVLPSSENPESNLP